MNGVGLAIPASRVDDRFIVALVHALAEPLIRSGHTLLTKVVRDDREEEDLYRHWAEVGGVSGVALLGVGEGDPRPPLLRTLGFPIAAVIDTGVDVDFPAVEVDFEASIAVLASFLESRPPRRTVYVTGVERGSTSSARDAATANAALAGLFEVVRIEHSTDAAVAAASAALSDGPATLVFDSDVHAAATFTALRARELCVPDDVAIISWTNSALCQSASRPITAIDRRGSEIGAMLGRRVLAAIAGDLGTHGRAPLPYVVSGMTA